MSNTTIYNAIVSKAETLFPSKQRMHNPYELSDNPELILRDAWGLKVGSAEFVDIEYCNLSIGREYTFLLTKQFATVGSAKDAFDVTTVAMLEDQQSMLSHLHSQAELGIPNDIDEITISNVGGIDFMVTDQKKYLFLELTFRITLSTAVI